MSKRLVSFISIICLFAVILCSCGQNNGSSNVVKGNTATTASQQGGDDNNSQNNDVVSDTTAKNNSYSNSDNDKSVAPVDIFTSIAQMKKKAISYTDISSVYASSGFSKDGDYYKGFEQKTLSMIFSDGFIQYPVLGSDTTFSVGGLSALGYYFIEFYYNDSIATIYEYTYNEPEKATKAYKNGVKMKLNTKNGAVETYELDGSYFFRMNGYWVELDASGVGKDNGILILSGLKIEKYNLVTHTIKK